MQCEVLLPVAPHPTTPQATANVKEQIRLYGKPSNYYCITEDGPRRGGKTYFGKLSIQSGRSYALRVTKLHMSGCSASSDERLLAPLCKRGFSLRAQFYFDAMYGTKAIHCVTRSYCWKSTPGMRTSNIATDEKILSRRQTSLLVLTRGSREFSSDSGSRSRGTYEHSRGSTDS